MEKNRLFIIISAAVAILSSFLPWASLNAGIPLVPTAGMAFAEMDGSLLSSQSLRLSCLLERCEIFTTKRFCNWCYRIRGSLNYRNIDRSIWCKQICC